MTNRTFVTKILGLMPLLNSLLWVGTTASLLFFQTIAFAKYPCAISTSLKNVDIGGACKAAGGKCGALDDLTDSICRKPDDQELVVPVPPAKNPKTGSEGSGTADPIGPTASPFRFSLASFEPGTFSYFKILDDGIGVVSLETLNFDSTLIFTGGADPSIMYGTFLDFAWLYRPFDLPSGLFRSIDREVLDTAARIELIDAILNLDTGQMALNIPVMWLTTDGTIVSRNIDHFDIQITPTSNPMFVDVQITDFSTLQILPIPEPTSVSLGIAAIAALSFSAYRRRKRATT